MNSTDALREFVEKWGNGTFNIRKQNECLSDLTALISEHYYPKEFVQWLGENSESDQENPVKWFMFVDLGGMKDNYMTTEEAFNYWKENEQ